MGHLSAPQPAQDPLDNDTRHIQKDAHRGPRAIATRSGHAFMASQSKPSNHLCARKLSTPPGLMGSRSLGSFFSNWRMRSPTAPWHLGGKVIFEMPFVTWRMQSPAATPPSHDQARIPFHCAPLALEIARFAHARARTWLARHVSLCAVRDVYMP